MTSPAPSPWRPRLSGRDTLPILAGGTIGAGTILIARIVADRLVDGQTRPLSSGDWAIAFVFGFALSFVIAGMQGRREELSLTRAVVAWARLAIVATVVLVSIGRPAMDRPTIRVAFVVLAALVVSLSLFVLRRDR